MMKNQSGIVFLTTIIILVVCILICTGLAAVILKDVYTIKQLKYAVQARLLAEAGVEETIRTLYDTSFDTSGYPAVNIPLGPGTYRVDLDTSKYVTDRLILIVATGTVRGVSRIAEVLVRDNTIDAFDYPVLGGGRCLVAGGLGLFGGQDTAVYGGDVCSNNANQNWAVQVGGILTTGYVDQAVYACGAIKKTWLGTINGGEYPNSPAVDLPPLDASFFQFYKDLAQNGGLYYAGSQTFSSGTYTPANGVIYVNGIAVVNGDVTINGCLVASGNIRINPDFSTSGFTQNQVGTMPALMTSGGSIEVYSRAAINGLIYSSNQITTFALPLDMISITGAVIGKGGVYLYAVTRVDFVRQNPPGIPVADSPLEVVCWSG